MNPATRQFCHPDFAVLTQYERYRAERDIFPAEYAAYTDLLKRGHIVKNFYPKAGHVGGSIVTIIKFRPDPAQ